MADPEKNDKPAVPMKVVEPPAPVKAVEPAAPSADMRIRAMEMALDFHKGMNPDRNVVLAMARTILDFVYGNPPA